MSNVNTFAGFYNLPAQLAVNTSANVLVVPASGYAGLPSPVLVSGAGLAISVNPDIAGGFSDVHPFKIKAYGKATTTGGAATIIPILYNVPATALGVIGTAGSVTSSGVVGTGTGAPVLIDTCATIGSSNVATVEFAYEWTMLFNKSAGSLSGAKTFAYTNFTSTAVYTAAAAVSGGSGTPTASGLGFADLNFELTFTFSAGTAPNAVTVTEFSIDRV